MTADAPNRRRVGDTEFVIGDDGKLYVAAILDLFVPVRRRVGGSAINDRHLTLKALEIALKLAVPRRSGCCTSRTRTARTPSRTTSGGSMRTVLPAR